MSSLERKDNDMDKEELIRSSLKKLNCSPQTIEDIINNLSEERKNEYFSSPNIDINKLKGLLDEDFSIIPKSSVLDKDRERILRSQIEKKKDV